MILLKEEETHGKHGKKEREKDQAEKGEKGGEEIGKSKKGYPF